MSSVYIITNKINGKQYVGITLGSLKRRMSAHISSSKTSGNGYVFHNALKKYGHESFQQELLYESDSYDHIKTMEIYFIALYDTYSTGSNMTLGGEGTLGRYATDATKQKMSKVRTGKICTEETKKRISESQLGKVVSDVSREKMSIAHAGKTLSESHKRNMSKSQLGRKHTPKTLKKMKDSAIKYTYTIYHPCGKITSTKYLRDFCTKYNVSLPHLNNTCNMNISDNVTDISKMKGTKGYRMMKDLL